MCHNETAVKPHQPPVKTKQNVTTNLSSSREILHQNAQQLIDDLNTKRKQDTQLLADYKKGMEMHVCILYLHI